MIELKGRLSPELQMHGSFSPEEVLKGNLSNEVLRGYSAYQVACLNGFVGTEKEWLDSLKYQHSTELTELATQVKNDAIQVNNDKLQVSKDKQTIELKAQEVNSSALSVSQNKSHIDNSVMEFNNKVAQANTTIDTKVEQASASANLSKQSATQSQNYSNVSASYVSQVSQDKAYIDTEIRKFNTTISQTKSEIEQNATSVESTKQQVSSLANQVKADAQSSALSSQNAKVSETNAKASEDKAKASEVIAKTNADNSSASAIQAENAKNIAIQNATKIEQSASQIEQNKNDILNFSIKNKASGNPCVITDSQDYELLDLKIYGQSEQNGTPSPDTPVEIVNKTVSEVKVTGKNLLNILDYKICPLYKDRKITVENGSISTTLFDGWSGLYLSFNQEFPAGKYRMLFGFKANGKYLSNYYMVGFNKKITVDEITLVYNDYYIGYSFDGYMGHCRIDAKESFKIFLPIGYASQKVGDKVEIENIRLVKDWDFVPYEPYKEQSIPLSTPIELRGLKSSQGNVIINGQSYISDVVKDKNGVIGVERNVGNIPSYTNEQITEPFMSSTGQLTQGANVVYKQTPTFEPLPHQDQDAIRKLKTNYPNTIIDCGAFVETEYCADTKLYIDQSISKYHAQSQANQVAMMSLLPDETQATMIEKDQQNLLKGV